METLFKLFTYTKHFILVHCLGIRTSFRSNLYTNKLFSILFWQFLLRNTLNEQNSSSYEEEKLSKWNDDMNYCLKTKCHYKRYRFHVLEFINQMNREMNQIGLFVFNTKLLLFIIESICIIVQYRMSEYRIILNNPDHSYTYIHSSNPSCWNFLIAFVIRLFVRVLRVYINVNLISNDMTSERTILHQLFIYI